MLEIGKRAAGSLLSSIYIVSRTRSNVLLCRKSPTATGTSYRFFSQWDIISGICLERRPVIVPDLTPVEKRYNELVMSLEERQSYYSNHEIRHMDDLVRAEKLEKGDEIDDKTALGKQTAQDFEDMSLLELKNFEVAPRITKADLANDRKSTQRKLDQSLLLVMKQKFGNDQRWCLPQTVNKEGESLRETAERGLKEICSSLDVKFLGNAPVGYYKYKYPKPVRENGTCGAKLFFFRAWLQNGNLNPEMFENNSSFNDFLWLLRSELKELLTPSYCKAVEAFLLPNETVQKDQQEPQQNDQMESRAN